MSDKPEHRPSEGSRQRRGAESRLAFLEAGAELLSEQSLESLLSTREIARRAQRTTGSFFHYWPDIGRFMEDLIHHVMRPGAVAHIDEIGSLLDQVADGQMTRARIVRLICDRNFTETVADPYLRLEMLLWSKSGDLRARDAVASFYERTDAMFATKYAGVAAAWKREPRPPFDYDTVATIFTALLEGLAIRRVVQPERVPGNLYGDVVLALLPLILRTEDDTRTFDDLAREIDS